MTHVLIEVRCKGIFAYLKGANQKRWLAMPKPPHYGHHNDEHVCQLHVLKSAVDSSNPNFTDVGDYVRFNEPLTGLEIVGATIGPIKTAFSSEISDTGIPPKPNEDESWTSQGYIASLTDFFPAMVSDITEAAFLMTLPDTTQWHGLAPSDIRVRECLWRFVKDADGFPSVGLKDQALTDVVGFFLIVPPETTLRVKTANGIVNVPVKFAEGAQSQLTLTAGPNLAEGVQIGKVLRHFAHLYHLSKPGPPIKVLPKCLGPVPGFPAGDIFCPGGEGEGEGGG